MSCSAYLLAGLKDKGGKGETFHLLWQPSALWGNITMKPPFLHPIKTALLSLSLWPGRENIPGHSMERKAY